MMISPSRKPSQIVAKSAKPAALNARRFWTNQAAVREGEPAATSLNGTWSGLGGRTCDRIGWGRLRSFASAERCGAAGLLNVVPAGQLDASSPRASVQHFRQHDDSHGGGRGGTISRTYSCICGPFWLQVSGDRIRRHFHRHPARV